MSGPLTAFSQIQAGKQAEKTAKFNAELYEMDAINAENQTLEVQNAANLEKNRIVDQVKEIQGSVKVGFAGGGVDISQGTPMTVLEENYQNAQLDLSITQYNANIEKTNLRNQAGRSRFQGAASIQQGKYAKYASRLGAATTLLKSAEQAASAGMGVPSSSSTAGSTSTRAGSSNRSRYLGNN